MAEYANVIVDISLDKLDRTFQYRIPPTLKEQIVPGVMVDIPFGNRSLTGYVVELTDEAEYQEEKIRPIRGIREQSVEVSSQLIALAGWMRSCYGSTMNQALKTVLPVHRKAKPIEHKKIRLNVDREQAVRQLASLEHKHHTARARLLRELLNYPELDYRLVTGKLNISASVIRGMEERGLIAVERERIFRNPIAHLDRRGYDRTLNSDQQRVVAEILDDTGARPAAYLIKGVTGSGKTEVYMELIAHTLQGGRQAIVLIPEIALTYQTAMRFYNRFGDRVSIMNSRLSAGERYDQFLRAKTGDIDIMIGPRSALFAPFARLGIIIIDEEHEASYKSETAPRYHARETAIERARMCGAKVVLGSATPSVDSFYQAQKGTFRLLELKHRVEEKALPTCEIVDLRRELAEGNRSILCRRLQELMEERLQRGEQIMLFLNRRGVSAFVSCRACGEVIRCPHCDVSLSRHNNGKMICHYCGYQEPVPRVCPSCGSRYIAGFGAGTQKIEEIVARRFPGARLLRMDYDTTRTRDAYEKILQSFANNEADILIGTQMIVKGHDFPRVTLVGVLAADLSLYVSDYRAAERTFQLLTQAVGRAGRGSIPGHAVIQTYTPDNYAVKAAKEQDYESFYRQEIAYRKLLAYPPSAHMLLIGLASGREDELSLAAEKIAVRLKGFIHEREFPAMLIGPADAAIGRINDIYRKVIYLKAKEYGTLVQIKDALDKSLRRDNPFAHVFIQYDFDPLNGF